MTSQQCPELRTTNAIYGPDSYFGVLSIVVKSDVYERQAWSKDQASSYLLEGMAPYPRGGEGSVEEELPTESVSVTVLLHVHLEIDASLKVGGAYPIRRNARRPVRRTVCLSCTAKSNRGTNAMFLPKDLLTRARVARRLQTSVDVQFSNTSVDVQFLNPYRFCVITASTCIQTETVYFALLPLCAPLGLKVRGIVLDHAVVRHLYTK